MNYNQFKNNMNMYNSIVSGNILSVENTDVNIEGDVEVVIIQGDTFSKEIFIEDIDERIIENIYVTCKDLDICKKCTKYKESYYLEFTSEESEKLKPYVGTYDLTIHFVAKEVITIGHNFPFIILNKKNEVNCNE